MRKIVFILLAFAILLPSCSSNPEATHIPATPESPLTRSQMTCTIVHMPVTPEAVLSAEFEGHTHNSGPVNAPVTIVAFSHYQCLECAFLGISLKQIRLTHPEDVRIVYINTPRAENNLDTLAIQATEASDLQGKFWEMHDLLFEKQAEWSMLVSAEFKAWAAEQATGLGLDAAQFLTDFEGVVVAGRVQKAVELAAGVPALNLPTFFVNSNSPYTGLADFASLDEVVRLFALTARQFSDCPTWEIDPLKQYIATLQTSRGDVVIELYADKAPQAVNNFIYLANNGWFDGMTFYRVLTGSLAQTGDPSGTGKANPGYLFETEIPAGLSFNQAGVVAMENNGPNTNGSRFFITMAPATQLDGTYTIFGHVLSGLDVLNTLTPRAPQPGVYLPQGDEIIHVLIDER